LELEKGENGENGGNGTVGKRAKGLRVLFGCCYTTRRRQTPLPRNWPSNSSFEALTSRVNSLSVALRSGYLSVRTSEKQSSLKARLRNGLTYLLTYLLTTVAADTRCNGCRGRARYGSDVTARRSLDSLSGRRQLATCVNYTKINNFLLRMRDHVSAFFSLRHPILCKVTQRFSSCCCKWKRKTFLFDVDTQ